MPRNVVLFSGGAASWAAAKRLAQRDGTDGLVLLFTDTAIESPDVYAFVRQGAANVGGELVWLKDGRTPWDVFHDVRFLGNARIDPCSRVLKREPAWKWLEENARGATVHLGYDATEVHRLDRTRLARPDWNIDAPLTWTPPSGKPAVLEWARREGLTLPASYAQGFAHANCGNFCVKAGMAHFRQLWQVQPETYLFHEREEQRLRDAIGKDVAVLRDRRGGSSRPMTLREFRESRLAALTPQEALDFGGCGCFSDPEGTT